MTRKIIFSLLGFLFGLTIAIFILVLDISIHSGFLLFLIILFGTTGALLGYGMATKINKLSQEKINKYLKIVFYIAITIFAIGFILQIIYSLLS